MVSYAQFAFQMIYLANSFAGVTPAYYRWAARKQISHYKTVTMVNGTVTDIQPEKDNAYFTVTGDYEGGHKITYTARKVVLATGVKDILPNTPGLQENFGNGIYWCPWCDGHEHADQQLGLLGKLPSVPGTVREIITLNKDIMAFTNGTNTDEAQAETEKKNPKYKEYLKLKNVVVDDRTISSIERLRNGSDPSADPSLPTHPEHDLFQINFETGDPVKRSAFLTSFSTDQASTLAEEIGASLEGGKIVVNASKGLETSVKAVYAIGDANNDGATNVPYALFSGKRTAVFLHVQLERENAAAELAAVNGTSSVARRTVHEEARDVWNRVNGKPGELLYAGDFDGQEIRAPK